MQKRLAVATFLIFIFFSTYKLGSIMFNPDAHFWYERTMNFMEAVKKQEWSKTYQNPKPGVTVMWLSGISIETFLKAYEMIYHFRPNIYTFDTFRYIHFAAKFPLVMIFILSTFYFYVLSKKMFGGNVALLAVILLSTQPFYIGVNRYFHGDGTLSNLMMLSSLILIQHLSKDKDIKFKSMVIVGILGGLAFLSKSQAIFLVPFYGLALAIKWIIERHSINEIPRLIIKNWMILIFFMLSSIFIFFPAAWINFPKVLSDILIAGTNVAEVGTPGDVEPLSIYITSIPKIFSPILIILAVVSLLLFKNVYKKAELNDKKALLMIFGFVFFYLMQMCIVVQRADRYLLPIYPFLTLIIAYILVKRFSPKQISRLTMTLFLLGNLYMLYNFPHFVALAEYKPYGSLYVDAADYLNKKNNAAELKVVAIPKPHTFKPFFKGKTYSKDETLPNGWKIDYLIKAPTESLPDKYSHCVMETNIKFRYKIFWEIYKCK